MGCLHKDLETKIVCECVVDDLGKEEDTPRVVKEVVECVCVGVRKLAFVCGTSRFLYGISSLKSSPQELSANVSLALYHFTIRNRLTRVRGFLRRRVRRIRSHSSEENMYSGWRVRSPADFVCGP